MRRQHRRGRLPCACIMQQHGECAEALRSVLGRELCEPQGRRSKHTGIVRSDGGGRGCDEDGDSSCVVTKDERCARCAEAANWTSRCTVQLCCYTL
jgi:hypothetical protein